MNNWDLIERINCHLEKVKEKHQYLLAKENNWNEVDFAMFAEVFNQAETLFDLLAMLE